MTRLSEAEVTGDTALVRSLLSQLSDRSRFPAKVLIFREDARPGYFGTWTRSSRFVGPRTPFAKDVLQFDYGYDSGEEWEDEPSGDADDVVDGEDEEIDSEDRDSDLDDWLVDDDEELDGPPSRELSQPPDVPLLPQKRKPEDADKKIGKKRKVVVPLVPFVKGPCWESTIGKCEYAPFSAYKIRHFNGTLSSFYLSEALLSVEVQTRLFRSIHLRLCQLAQKRQIQRCLLTSMVPLLHIARMFPLSLLLQYPLRQLHLPFLPLSRRNPHIVGRRLPFRTLTCLSLLTRSQRCKRLV